MDLDKALVSSLLQGEVGDVKRAREKGIRSEYLQGDGQVAYDFLSAYVDTYGGVPTPDMIMGKTGVDVGTPPPGAAEFYVDEILNRSLHNLLRKWGKTFLDTMEKRDGKGALGVLEEAVKEARKHEVVVSRVESVPRLFQDVWTYYERVKAGERGIQTPWQSLNDESLGFWPGEIVLFVARTGIGKTWSAALIAHHAWKIDHKRVLFATTEISKLRIAMRFAAIHCVVPYKLLRKGMLDSFAEQRVKQEIDAVMNEDGLFVVGGNFDFSLESLDAAIDECNPDLLIVDGAYLLKSAGTSRIEKAANAFDELKRLVIRKDIPSVVTTQFNRDVKANVAASVRTESIALTDVASWNADLIFGLIQTDDMKRDKRMIFKPLKGREMIIDEFETWWDLDTMNFAELPHKQSGGAGGKGSGSDSQDDDFDTGLGAGSAGQPDDSGVPF